MSDYKTRHAPFGWDRGDPIIVCLDELDHMEYVQRAFQMKAYYCGPLARLTGRQTHKIVVFTPHLIRGSSEELSYNRWVNENLRTCLTRTGEIFFV